MTQNLVLGNLLHSKRKHDNYCCHVPSVCVWNYSSSGHDMDGWVYMASVGIREETGSGPERNCWPPYSSSVAVPAAVGSRRQGNRDAARKLMMTQDGSQSGERDAEDVNNPSEVITNGTWVVHFIIILNPDPERPLIPKPSPGIFIPKLAETDRRNPGF